MTVEIRTATDETNSSSVNAEWAIDDMLKTPFWSRANSFTTRDNIIITNKYHLTNQNVCSYNVIHRGVVNMTNISLKGTIISAVKVISFDPYLVRFTLQTTTQDYNCLIAKDALNFMYVAETDAPIAIYGHYNQRKQLVIDQYYVRTAMSA